jgi:hypothetical protein
MNISAPKKDLLSQIDLEVQKTESQNKYDGQADVVKPIVAAILDKYKDAIANDEVPVSVNVSSGGVSGRTGLAINVNW